LYDFNQSFYKMRFNIATLTTGALALGLNSFAAALTSGEVVTNINTLTTKIQALEPTAQSINAVNGELILLGGGPLPVISHSWPFVV
jgi:hypothetical protein